MARETKVGLLIGVGFILLVAIIVSDHLSVARHADANGFTRFAEHAQASLAPGEPDPLPPTAANPGRTPQRSEPIPTPDELQAVPRSTAPAAGPQFRDLPRAMTLDFPAPDAGPRPDLTVRQPDGSPPRTDTPTLVLSHELDTAPAAAPARVTVPSARLHRVEPGESLAHIARQYYGDSDRWPVIARANPDRVAENGGVRAGVELVIPDRVEAVFADRFERVGQPRTQAAAANRSNTPAQQNITVAAGQTLSGLAARHLGSAGRWRELLEANRDTLESPQDLRAGMTLRLPADADAAPASGSRTYRVSAGDSLASIARRHLGDADRWRDLYDANRDRLKDPDALRVGQELVIPR